MQAIGIIWSVYPYYEISVCVFTTVLQSTVQTVQTNDDVVTHVQEARKVK